MTQYGFHNQGFHYLLTFIPVNFFSYLTFFVFRPWLGSTRVGYRDSTIQFNSFHFVAVSPIEMGVVGEVVVPQPVKRGLMLMSKILQNIANHVEFSKEQHMIPFNDFLKAHFEVGRR